MTIKAIQNHFRKAFFNSEPLKHSRYGNYLEMQNVHFKCTSDYIFPNLNDHAFSENWYKENYWPIIENQIEGCLNELKANKDTRDAVLIMGDRDCYKKHDFICTEFMHIFINKDHLKYIVNMRSSDAAKFHNDYCWHLKIFNLIKQELDIFYKINFKQDKMEWNAGSLHIYEKDFDFLN